MIYVTGDIHAEQYVWKKYIAPTLSSGDILIVTGEFGVGFWNGCYWSEETFYDYVSEQSYTVLFVDGNHENFDKLNSYPVEHWNGGRVHKLRHNLIHLMRGEIYNIEGRTVFAFGGGYSLDRYRRAENISWWPQEMPSKEERDNAERILENAIYKADYIITHTAPSETVYYLSKIRSYGIKECAPEELPLTAFLDSVQRRVSYKRWYFGHFHVDGELWRDQTAMFSTIRELDTGRAVKHWEPYI